MGKKSLSDSNRYSHRVALMEVGMYTAAAKRFFKKMARADHGWLLFVVGVDECASDPEVSAASVEDEVTLFDREFGRVKYLNNVIEQDYLVIGRWWRAAPPAPSTPPSGHGEA